MYNLSRDYERLFDIVCVGHVVAGFVDFKFDPHDKQEKPCRDIVKIQRRKEWDVHFGVRGMSYASMLSYMGEDLNKTEKDSFCGYCRALNLEWVAPEVKLPQGWVLVPEVATQAMCIAGQDKAKEWRSFPLRIVPIFRAMCDAAPDAPGLLQT